MQFFLYEILARIVAIYLCFDCSRTLWSGLVERRISYTFGRGDILDWLFTSPSKWTVERDAAPSYAEFWVTRRSGGVVCRHVDDLDAVVESDTCNHLRQLICAFEPPPSF